MISRRTAGLLFALPLTLLLAIGTAPAQEGTSTITKTPPAPSPAATPPAKPQGLTEPEDAPGPPPGEATGTTGTPAPSEEMAPAAVDEGAGWEAAVEAAQSSTPLIGEEQTRAVERINAYFNGITNLQGSFEQVDSTNKTSSGRFYVQRPGKIRFDYAPPSALRIVADGSHLAIEDSDLKTVEKYPIQSTPFKLLLSEAVDLARDARVVGVESQDGTLAVTLEDKSGDAAGSIRLVFESSSELQLKEWSITDAQGLTTRVTVRDVVPGRKVAADFFTAKEGFQPFR
ncbi:MAG TPA: outer membrane lipoprotein carrier protein LolA [Methyloceanibacter sp.]|jgi:outer membrane lipoprotein-sorting protein|nr:outer membrane lipoprotein carrier protein LolA [Methyloceanibacter sp.]